MVIGYTMSIILTLYGEYLINRFQLEIRFPKLATFIQLRRKLQAYFLKISLGMIFIATLPQLYIYIWILSSKILEILNG